MQCHFFCSSVNEVVAALQACPTLVEGWRSVGEGFKIPEAVLEHIDSSFPNDSKLRAVVEYWLQRDPFKSWRKVAYALDDWNDDDVRRVADAVRRNAETLQG